jgi:CRP-like cAMP-binding protein
MQRIPELIADTPGFAGLAAQHLEQVAGCGALARFEPGAYLFREGEPAARFFLVRSGAVALEVFTPRRGPVTIQTLHEGEIAGWSWLFEPYRWAFDGRAVDDVHAITFDGACLRGKCDADHELGYQLMRRFATTIVARLQATRFQLLDVYGREPVG